MNEYDGEVYIGNPIQVQGDVCPSCGRFLDGCTGIGDKPSNYNEPHPGAYTICTYCCTLLKFDNNMKFVLVPDTERDFILGDNPIVSLMMKELNQIKINRELMIETWGKDDDPWS